MFSVVVSDILETWKEVTTREMMVTTSWILKTTSTEVVKMAALTSIIILLRSTLYGLLVHMIFYGTCI